MLGPQYKSQKDLISRVAGQLHTGQYFEAAKLASEWASSITKQQFSAPTKKSEADVVLYLLLKWTLDHEGYEEAAELLWSPNQFDARPQSTKEVWEAFRSSKLVMLMGAGSMSKSYSMGCLLLLEWLRDPEYTTVQLVGPSADHLEKNLFSHLVALHKDASIPLPGLIGQLFIGLDPRNKKSSISGLIIPPGNKAAGRLQGAKRVQRKKAHPTFGSTSRMFIFLDEVENIPKGIWKDVDNLMTGMGDGTLKIVCAFNPNNQYGDVGKRCEPDGGYENLDPDKHFTWMSTRGWKVVRLDAHRCENVVQKKVLFPGLQTVEGLNLLARNSGGIDSSGYWTMGRGMFPPKGVAMCIIPSGLLADFKAEVIWYERPTPVGSCDCALLGGDVSIFAKGSYGRATGLKFPGTVIEPAGRTVMFKDAQGRVMLRPMLLLEALFKLPAGDTVQMTNSIVQMSRTLQIRPEYLCIDRTGNGAGVHDLCKTQYGDGVVGINYSESASETKIMLEDHGTAYELYERQFSELWFATRKFIEFCCFKILPGIETDPLYSELTGRKYRPVGSKSRAEEKSAYALRNMDKSPDTADAVTLLVALCRRAFNWIPGMDPTKGSDTNPSEEDGDDEGWPRVCCTNRNDTMD